MNVCGKRKTVLDDTISNLPDVTCADASLPNPSGIVPRAADTAGATDAVAAAETTDDADERSSRSGSGGSESTALWADGGYDVDQDRDTGRVRDAGLVVRLEADGVLFHEGEGRSNGRWIAAGRDDVVSLGEVQ